MKDGKLNEKLNQFAESGRLRKAQAAHGQQRQGQKHHKQFFHSENSFRMMDQ